MSNMLPSKPTRPSLDTSFASPSLERPAQQRTRADSAASHSSSSAFATPPEGHSPRHSNSLPLASSTSASTIKRDPKDDSTKAPTPRIHSRNASVGSAPLYEFVKAKYDYIPDHPSGLPFYAGQLIQVHYKDQSGWWDGEVSNIRGWFPSNYLFQNSSVFIRATSNQSPRVQGIHRPRNASIDVVTPSDIQTVQARPLLTNARSEQGSQPNPNVITPPLSNSGTATAPAPSMTVSSNPYSSVRARQPSLATTEEQDETEEQQQQQPTRATRPDYFSRSASSQNVSTPITRSTVRPALQQHHHHTTSPSTSYHPGHASMFFGNQQQQQDWASLSFEDLVALQILLVNPSPLSKLRHSKPATPFEADLASQLFTFAHGRPPSFSTESDWDYKTGGTQFLAVVHRALWVLENAALATSADEFYASPNPGSSTSPINSPQLEGRDHLAPAMACVIGIVRSVLSTSECLARDSVNLQKYPTLLGHRKVVLGELARLVSQTRRVGSRGLEDEPLSPLADDMSRRGSEISSHGFGSSPLSASSSSATTTSSSSPNPFQLVFDNTQDIEIRRELERCQAVYDGVRRFVIAAAQCGIHLDTPPRGVLGLFGLLEDEYEDGTGNNGDGGSEAEGSWEEDHGFRFRVRSGSIGRFEEGVNGGGGNEAAANNSRYALRAKRFADTRPGHGRRRTGSNTSMASGYASGSAYGGGGTTTTGTTNSKLLAAIEGIEQRLEKSRLSNESSRSGESADVDSSRQVTSYSNNEVVDIATPPESEVEGTPGAASALAAAAALRAARSMNDMRPRYQIRTARESHIRPQAPDARFTAGVKAARRARVIHGRSVQNNSSMSSGPDMAESAGANDERRLSRVNKSSISSVSSAESSSSAQSSSPTRSSSSPSSPGLPSGQCTVTQVLQALRITQDRILHGTAAFIGAAQYHSKTSHPASKGYLVALTREIVDYVRRLLIIADAVLGNSTIRAGRAREVEMAGVYKARLYVEMNRVVDAVRELTAIRRGEESDAGSSADHGGDDADEEEKGAALKRAHLANKCAAELVLALKLCLSFRVGNAANKSGEGALMITIPDEVGKIAGDKESSKSPSPRKGSKANMSISISKASVVSPERSPKPYSRLERVNGAAGDNTSYSSSISAANRNRSFTTRNEQVDHEVKFGLHKKSASMVGMGAVYRGKMAGQDARSMHDALQMKRSKKSIQEAMVTYLEIDEERDEESDGERHPLLMSETYDSDGQEDGAEEQTLNEYPPPPPRPVEEDPDYIKVKPARRSVEQVRLSLERGLRHSPSMNLIEPSTPIDGTEIVEIVEEGDEEEEDEDEPESTLAPSMAEKELPEPPKSAPLTAPPTHAPPPKPAHHDNLVVSNNGNIVFNKEGVLVGATLQALVDRMTPAEVIGDPKLASHFLLTFRLFATPNNLVDAIIHRFNYPVDGVPMKDDDPMTSSNSLSDAQRTHITNVVQLRVINFVKEWTKTHWYPPHDQDSLPKLISWFKELATGSNPMITSTAKRMLPSLEEMSGPDVGASDGANTGTVRDRLDRMRSAVRLRDHKNAVAMAPMQASMSPTTPLSTTPLGEMPRPELTKSLMNQLKAKQFGNVSLLEFSPVEMARQLTILESRLYCALPPEELIEIDLAGRRTPHVKALTTLSTSITGWVTDWVLKEGLDLKKRVQYIKFFLKVGKECLALNNYSTPRSLMAALESTPISRLKSVWAAVSPKNKAIFQEMHELADHSNNSRNYRRRLEATALPAIPFLGRILTDVTFVKEGNRPYRESPVDPSKKLINFNRYNFLAKILGDMIRFQQPYSLREISEMQQYLTYVLDPSRFMSDANVLYRRSNLIEPRVDDDKQAKASDLFNWGFGSVRGNNPFPPQ